MHKCCRLLAVLGLFLINCSATLGDVNFSLNLALHNKTFRSVEGNAVEGVVAEGFTTGVNLGTPSQLLNLYLDTGSSDLAVASYPNANLTEYFHRNRSSTYKSEGKQVWKNFVEGSYNGTAGSDVLQDSSGNLSLEVPLITLSSSRDIFPHQSPWQGLWGLAFPTLSEVGTYSWMSSSTCICIYTMLAT